MPLKVWFLLSTISFSLMMSACAQQTTIVTVTNEKFDPARPVAGVRVTLTYFDGSQKVADAQRRTNRDGQTELEISAEARRQDLRIEISGVEGLVVYEPAEGLVERKPFEGASAPPPPREIRVVLLPLGAPKLLKNAQIEAMINRLSRQNQNLQVALSKEKGRRSNFDEAVNDWAAANGFKPEDVNLRISEWSDDILAHRQQASLVQQAEAELGARHYMEAATLFEAAKNNTKETSRKKQSQYLEQRYADFQTELTQALQSSKAYASALDFNKATRVQEDVLEDATVEHTRYPNDPGLEGLWIEAVAMTAFYRELEGDAGSAQDSLALLNKTIEGYRQVISRLGVANLAKSPSLTRTRALTQAKLSETLYTASQRTAGAAALTLLTQSEKSTKDALVTLTETQYPEDWADAQMTLGLTLSYEAELGPAEKADDTFERADAAYKSALKYYGKTAHPKEWASVMLDIALLRTAQGNFSKGTLAVERTQQAVEAMREALDVLTPEDKKAWALAECNLSDALSKRANLEPDDSKALVLFVEAEKAARKGLASYDKQKQPLEWASAELELGVALVGQGSHLRESQARDQLTEGVAATRAALAQYTKDSGAQEWARLQTYLGSSLGQLADVSAESQIDGFVDESIMAFRAALEVYQPEFYPEYWLRTQSGLARMLNVKAGRLEGPQQAQLLMEALAASQTALRVLSKDLQADEWVNAQVNLGNTLYGQAMASSGDPSIALANESFKAFEEAEPLVPRSEYPSKWIIVKENMANCKLLIGMRTKGVEGVQALDGAIALFREAFQVDTIDRPPTTWASAQHNLGIALQNRADRTDSKDAPPYLTDSVAAFEVALQGYNRNESPKDWGRTQLGMGNSLNGLESFSSGEEANTLLAQAEQAHREAVNVFGAFKMEKLKAEAEADLGGDLAKRGSRLSGIEAVRVLRESVDAFTDALNTYTKTAFPEQWGTLELALANAYFSMSLLVEGKDKDETLDHQIEAFAAALQMQPHNTLARATTETLLGISRFTRSASATPEQKTLLLGQAVENLRSALQYDLKTEAGVDFWATTESELAAAYQNQGRYAEAVKTLNLVLEIDPGRDYAAQSLSAIYHDNIIDFQRSYDLLASHPAEAHTASDFLNRAEASLTVSKFEECLDWLGKAASADIPARSQSAAHILTLACQYGGGRREALTTAQAIADSAAGMERSGWTTTGDRTYLAQAKPFASGRASWIALFKSLDDNDASAMSKAAHELAAMMEQ